MDETKQTLDRLAARGVKVPRTAQPTLFRHGGLTVKFNNYQDAVSLLASARAAGLKNTRRVGIRVYFTLKDL